MPNKIDTDSIIRHQQDHIKDNVKSSNADYVTNLEKTSSIMPPEKPFETKAAQSNKKAKEESDTKQNRAFVQKTKEETNEILRIDKTNETKLFLLNSEYDKISSKLGDGAISKKEKASLESLIQDVEAKIELYKSKLQAGASGADGVRTEELENPEDGIGDGIGEAIVDALKDQILMAAPGLIFGAAKKKEEEEEEEKEEDKGKEYDQ